MRLGGPGDIPTPEKFLEDYRKYGEEIDRRAIAALRVLLPNLTEERWCQGALARLGGIALPAALVGFGDQLCVMGHLMRDPEKLLDANDYVASAARSLLNAAAMRRYHTYAIEVNDNWDLIHIRQVVSTAIRLGEEYCAEGPGAEEALYSLIGG